MARHYFRSLALLVLVALVVPLAGPAVAVKGADKKPKAAPKAPDTQEKHAAIKALEGAIHQMREQEKAALKQLDHRYDHVLHNIDPKNVHQKMEETHQVLQHVHKVITEGDFDYGGHRHAAQESVKAAEHQVGKALKHNTAEERSRASKDLLAAHRDVSKALAYSVEKYGTGNGTEKGEPETRAAANRQLAESVSKIELAHHLLAAVSTEITDYKQAKHNIATQRDAEKKTTAAQYATNIHQLEQELKALKK